jgi:Haem-binding domain
VRRVASAKRVLLGSLVALVAIQFIPVERSNPPVRLEVQAPPEVAAVLRRACYDCHSNETKWPWYAHVAPMSWLLSAHVRSGRGDVNFSEWPALDTELQALAFDDIRKQIEQRKMPLWSYLLLHPEARLTEADRRTLLGWAREESARLPPPEL